MENETMPQETLDLSEIIDELSRELKESTEWNQVEKEPPWNTSSPQKVSMECLFQEQADQNITTSKIKVVDILNNLFKVHLPSEKHLPYLGPSSISEWILTNLISQFNNKRIMNWFQKYSHQHPYDFYQRYLLVKDFVDSCSKYRQISPDSMNSKFFSDQELYIEYASRLGLSKSKANILISLYRHFQPFCTIEIPIRKRVVAPYLNHSLVSKHLEVLKKNGLLQESIREQKVACRTFLTWICRTYREFNHYDFNELPLQLVQESHLLEFRLYLKRQISNKLMDDKTISTQFYYVRSLFKSLYRMSLLRNDVSSDVKGLPFENYHYRDIPNDEELQRFFDVVRTYSPSPSLHVLLYSLMLCLGLRISEVLSLCWENFNLSTRTLSWRGKDGEYSIMPIPVQIQVFLKNHMDSPLKGSIINGALSAYKQSFNRYHQLYCLLADWTFDRGGFHLFRHTYITRLSQVPQCTPRLLMKLARHAKPASTSIYIHRSNKALQDAAERIDYSLP